MIVQSQNSGALPDPNFEPEQFCMQIEAALGGNQSASYLCFGMTVLAEDVGKGKERVHSLSLIRTCAWGEESWWYKLPAKANSKIVVTYNAIGDAPPQREGPPPPPPMSLEAIFAAIGPWNLKYVEPRLDPEFSEMLDEALGIVRPNPRRRTITDLVEYTASQMQRSGTLHGSHDQHLRNAPEDGCARLPTADDSVSWLGACENFRIEVHTFDCMSQANSDPLNTGAIADRDEFSQLMMSHTTLKIWSELRQLLHGEELRSYMRIIWGDCAYILVGLVPKDGAPPVRIGEPIDMDGIKQVALLREAVARY